MTAALVAVHALLDADTEGDVAETVFAYLTKDDPYDVEGKPHADSLALLFGAMTQGEILSLREQVGLCIVHGCDVEICADDENPECAPSREVLPESLWTRAAKRVYAWGRAKESP